MIGGGWKPAGRSSVRGRLLTALKAVPAGRVTTPEVIGVHLSVSPAEVLNLLANLSEEEQQAHAWHRVVAKGGAIGRGPWRERQFALLVREGLAVSPAGIVQDLARAMVVDLNEPPPAPAQSGPASPAQPAGRSRGMKQRPGP